MNLIDTAKGLAANENIEFQTRCSFCNGLEESCGELGVETAPGQFMEIPIGPKCLKRVQDSPANWVDNPHEVEHEM
jgi:hypothetical protein